jgi:hypothetical protein
MLRQSTTATYLVECFWPGVREEQVAEAGARLKLCAAQLSREGQRVSFQGSILVPFDEVVFYLFEGISAAAVHATCRRARLNFERVLLTKHKSVGKHLITRNPTRLKLSMWP